MIKAVFLDFDHTLQDLDNAYDVALKTVLVPAFEGAGVPPADLKNTMNLRWPGLWHRFLAAELEEHDLYLYWLRDTLTDLNLPVAEPGLLDLTQRYQACFEASLALYPEVMSSIQTLIVAKPQLTLAILTNGPTDRQSQRIATHGLTQYISLLCISEALGVSKPDRRFFQAALHQAKVTGSQAVMIGDNPIVDIGGASAVGIRTIWLNRSDQPWPSDLRWNPDGEARDLSQAVDHILRWMKEP